MRTPSYRLHRPSGQAVVTIKGKDHYLGIHGTPASKEKYRRLVAQFLSGQSSSKPGGSIAELAAAFLQYAEKTLGPRRQGHKQVTRARRALTDLVSLYGSTPANNFGPKELRLVRFEMGRRGWCRQECNRLVIWIRRVWKWAVVEELVTAANLAALSALPSLRNGEPGFGEAPKRRAASLRDVVTTCRRTPADVRAFCLALYWSGARPSELANVETPHFIKVRDDVLALELEEHKTDWRENAGKRIILFGPRACAALKPLMKRRPTGPLFRMGDGSSRGRDYYRILNLIAEARTEMGVKRWTPYELRHAAGTRFIDKLGDTQARRLLGHVAGGALSIYDHNSPDVAAIRKCG